LKFVARVAATDGPLASGRVEIVSSEGGGAVTIGKGDVTHGTLSATIDAVTSVWGIWINRRAVVAFPVSVEGEVVDLGEIVMVPDGLPWPAFHAEDGRVYGIPRAAQALASAPGPAPPDPPVDPKPLPTGDPLPRLTSRMTLGEMFGSTARQLAVASNTVSSNFTLAGATVTLKGVPSATQDAISLEFPTPEVAATGVGLSEISFSIRPKVETPAAEPAHPGTTVPDLIGYTRELAIRKAVAAGFITEINNEIVGDAANAGKVIRHLPRPGAALASGGLIRLYIGMSGGR
jgi:hypothetical protein